MERRNSTQRQVILNVLRSTKSHPDASWIYAQTKEVVPEISLGTVYRNLKLLSEDGSIKRIVVDDTVEHYDADTSIHRHFICSKCKKVFDVDVVGDIKVADEDFQVINTDIQFYGFCPNCLK